MHVPTPRRVHLFGVPEIATSSPAHAFPAKGYILLALLLLCRTGALTRHSVATRLWSDVDEPTALANLRQLLVRVRRAESGPDALVACHESGLIAGPAAQSSDLAEFLALRDATDAAGAVRGVHLFRGDLLEGLDDEDADLALWLQSQRALLRETFFSLALIALNEATRFGAATRSEMRVVEAAMLDLDPEREESYRVLLDCYGRIGDFDATKRLKGRLL